MYFKLDPLVCLALGAAAPLVRTHGEFESLAVRYTILVHKHGKTQYGGPKQCKKGGQPAAAGIVLARTRRRCCRRTPTSVLPLRCTFGARYHRRPPATSTTSVVCAVPDRTRALTRHRSHFYQEQNGRRVGSTNTLVASTTAQRHVCRITGAGNAHAPTLQQYRSGTTTV